MPEAELFLRSAYRAFNARDIEAAIELMHPEVDWPNAWEGGRVLGRAAVRDYWTRQFASISGKVEQRASPRSRTGASRSMCIRWSTTRAPVSSSPTRAFVTGTGLRMDSLSGWTFWSHRTSCRGSGPLLLLAHCD